MPPVTRALILANVLVYVLQGAYGEVLVASFALWPVGRYAAPEFGAVVGFQPWQLLTSSLLHGNFLHLFLNMFALWMFGRDVELAAGSRRFFRLYLAAVLSGALVQLAVVSAPGAAGPYPTVGASGGVFGILLAFGLIFPRRIVTPLFPPIPMPAWLFVTLFGLIELSSGIFGTASGVAHFAHLGGMLGAWLVLRRWRG